MKLTLSIRRYNPDSGTEEPSYIQPYDVDAKEGMTVLEALLYISDAVDPTLAFRKSCRSAICGSCAVNINGVARLACSTQLIPEWIKAGVLLVEPISNHTVLKDLVVDFIPFWKKMEKIKPYLLPAVEQGGETTITQEAEKAIDRSQQCIMCGCCNAECNALDIDKHFLGPAALAKAWRFVGDAREAGGKKRLGRLSDDHGMWDCVRCVRCVEYCPKDVAPLKAIEALRSRAMQENIRDNPGAKHVEALVNSVRRVGRLDEAAMTFKTIGFLRSLGMIPFGIKMELHGKMPMPLIFAQIKEIDEVRTIYEEAERLNSLPKTEK
ncbi:MAG: succinate dehydrogenase/fumarate reductase iron-sulfur subunit [Deltaproteobacteria bacterium]